MDIKACRYVIGSVVPGLSQLLLGPQGRVFLVSLAGARSGRPQVWHLHRDLTPRLVTKGSQGSL
ncbi:MAG: hypothetical protein M0Z46_03565 [Actinomycetota bacterium]|nr:hypothetical protein [Actinomycetota bacterium]